MKHYLDKKKKAVTLVTAQVKLSLSDLIIALVRYFTPMTKPANYLISYAKTA